MAAKYSRIQLIVWYYIRTEYEDQFDKVNMPMPLKYLITNFSKKVIQSKILTMNEDNKFIKALSTKLPNIDKNKFKLLFRGSQHGFLSSKFHELCDNHGPTLVIIQSNYGHVFGGYTSKKWSSISQYVKDVDAFLFVLRSSNPSQETPELFESEQPEYAMNKYSYYSRSFGDGANIFIDDKCDKSDTNYSYNFFCVFINKLTGNTLCGGNNKFIITKPVSYHFKVIEYEVFEMISY